MKRKIDISPQVYKLVDNLPTIIIMIIIIFKLVKKIVFLVILQFHLFIIQTLLFMSG